MLMEENNILVAGNNAVNLPQLRRALSAIRCRVTATTTICELHNTLRAQNFDAAFVALSADGDTRALSGIDLVHHLQPTCQTIAVLPAGAEKRVRKAVPEWAFDCLDTGANQQAFAHLLQTTVERNQESHDSPAQKIDPRYDESDHLMEHTVEHSREQRRRGYVESTRALIAAVEAKDPYTRAHSVTVSLIAEGIASRLKMDEKTIETLKTAALLHDVGKIGVPDAILTKPGPLTDEEYAVVQKHPVTALEILGHVSFLAQERPMILHHHERYDGKGYPSGLKANRIPLGARVLAMADAVDAMFSPRSYKPAYDVDRVKAEVAAGSGSQFDPDVAEATLDWLEAEPASIPKSRTEPME